MIHNIETDGSEVVEQFLNDCPNSFLRTIDSVKRAAGSVWVTLRENHTIGSRSIKDIVQNGWVVVSHRGGNPQNVFMFRPLTVKQREVKRVVSETETVITTESV